MQQSPSHLKCSRAPHLKCSRAPHFKYIRAPQTKCSRAPQIEIHFLGLWCSWKKKKKIRMMNLISYRPFPAISSKYRSWWVVWLRGKQKKSIHYWTFHAGPPRKYWFSWMGLNFAERTGCGAFPIRWTNTPEEVFLVTWMLPFLLLTCFWMFSLPFKATKRNLTFDDL